MLIESLFRDGTALWVRIVNGINKYVTETSETISLDNAEYRATGRLVAAVTLSSISIPLRESILRDFSSRLFCVSKAMIRLLRHDQSVPREDDGAVRFDDIMEEFRKEFDGALQYLFWKKEEGFTEYIYHVGNASEMNSIVRNGLIPGRKSQKTKTICVLDDDHGLEETPWDLHNPRINPYKNSWKHHQNAVFGAI